MPKIKEVNIYATSRKFPDGSIAEMVYRPSKDETSFLHYTKGKYKLEPNYLLGEETNAKGEVKIIMLKPLPPFSDMIKTGFLKLPSGVTEYKNELELYKQIKKYIDTYVVLPDDFSTIAAVYVMMSWIHDQFQALPYLRVIGMYGTGKSRFLSVVGGICYQSMMAGGSTTSASVFRTNDQVRGTFVLDEADFRASEMWSDIVKILNGGQTQGSPVIRMEPKGDGFITKAFHVFGPKVLASREQFADKALESRCLTQIMLPQEKVSVPVHLPENFEAEAARLRNRLLAFRFKFYGHVKTDEESLPKIKDNRLRQSSLALTSTADIIGKDVVKQIGVFLQTYEKNLDYDDISDPKVDVVEAILRVLEERKTRNYKLRIGDIASMFKKRFDADYMERITEGETETDEGWSRSRSTTYNISPRKIGSHIKQLNIRTVRDGQGYYIPIQQEYGKIKSLAHKYGFDKRIQLPDVFLPGSVVGEREEDDDEDKRSDYVPATPEQLEEAGKEFNESIGHGESENNQAVNEVNVITDQGEHSSVQEK